MLNHDEVDLILDPEFADLLPPQSEEEVQQLADNIKDCGCISPLVAWVQITETGTTFTLVDGYTRYKICKKTGDPYQIFELSFNNRAEVLEWIYENQRGRRNWSAEREGYVRGKVYNEKKKNGGARAKGVSGGNIANNVAKESASSPRTVQRDGQYAAGIDRVAQKAPELKTALLDGKAAAPKKAIAALATATDAEVDQAVEELRSGARKPTPAKATPSVLFARLESQAGSLTRTIDELNAANPNPAHAGDALNMIDDLLEIFSKWQAEAEPYPGFNKLPQLVDGVFQ